MIYIDNLNEVTMMFSAKILVQLTWYDSRLSYYNLKAEMKRGNNVGIKVQMLFKQSPRKSLLLSTSSLHYLYFQSNPTINLKSSTSLSIRDHFLNRGNFYVACRKGSKSWFKWSSYGIVNYKRHFPLSLEKLACVHSIKHLKWRHLTIKFSPQTM